MKRAIINLATGNYLQGQLRLMDSLYGKTDAELLLFTDESQVGAPRHEECPYGFKLYCIQEAYNRGYDQVLWLDASVYAVKDIQPVWDWIDRYGYFMEEAGHWCGDWCNDHALQCLNTTREAVKRQGMFAGGYCGFNFHDPLAAQFLSRWKQAMECGAFKGDWKNHRHEMVTGSIIAHQLGMKFSTGGTFFAYIGEAFDTPKETVVCHLQGIA